MRAIRLSDMMKCPISNTTFKDMIDCLRKVDAKKIVDAVYNFYVNFYLPEIHITKLNTFVFHKKKEWDLDPAITFPPVVENLYQSEEEAFIADYQMKKHSFDIPWLVGITSDEGVFRTAG